MQVQKLPRAAANQFAKSAIILILWGAHLSKIYSHVLTTAPQVAAVYVGSENLGMAKQDI